MRTYYHCIFIVIFTGYFISGCGSNKERQARNLESITLTNELTISADLDEALIGNFTGLAIGPNGTIYTADTKQQKIHIFSSQGEYQDSIGRKGKGPGEFSNLDQDIKIQGDTLYTLQARARRIDLFNINSGDHIRSISIPEAKVDGIGLGNVEKIFPQPDGSFMIYLMSPHYFPPAEDTPPKFATITRLDAFGNFTDKNVQQFLSLFPSKNALILQEDGAISVYKVNIYPEYAIAAGRDGSIYQAITDSLKISEYSNEGKLNQVLKTDYQRIPYTSEDMNKLVDKYDEKLRKAITNAGIPDFWPAFRKMIIDDEGRCWVQLFKPEADIQPWWVFDEEGEPAWKVELPTAIELFKITADKAYGIEQTDNALPKIHQYGIKM